MQFSISQYKIPPEKQSKNDNELIATWYKAFYSTISMQYSDIESFDKQYPIAGLVLIKNEGQ